MIVRDKRAVLWMEEAQTHLDVRPILEDGGEPYSVIMDAIGQLERSKRLTLHVLFDPVPLRKQLERMNYSCHSEMLENDHWLMHIESK